MSSIVTNKGHSKRAISWYNDAKDAFIGIGRTTSWEDEMNPPNPTYDSVFEEPICYKQIEQKFYVVPDDTGTIFYRNQHYKIIQENEVVDQKCRWVFCSCWLNYDEAPVGVGYRQIGLFTGLKRNPGISIAQYVLLPSQVASEGDLEVLSNDTVTYRSESKRERLAVIIEF